MGQKLEAKNETLQVAYGHTETEVVMQFGRPIDNLRMSPAQVDETVKSLLDGKAKLAEYQAEQKKAKQ